VQFVQPLGWMLDLDLRGDQVRTFAEVFAWSSKPRRAPTYRLAALRCRIVAACVSSDDVRRELHELAERCDQIWERPLSLAGMKEIATGDIAALRKLTRDARVLERLQF
jgi:hypothetical protein